MHGTTVKISLAIQLGRGELLSKKCTDIRSNSALIVVVWRVGILVAFLNLFSWKPIGKTKEHYFYSASIKIFSV